MLYMHSGRNYVDISPWMLFEASGDSELDSGKSCSSIANGDVGKLMSSSATSSGDLEEDDAFSCSWECQDDSNSNCCNDLDDSQSHVCFIAEDDQYDCYSDDYLEGGSGDEEEEEEEAESPAQLMMMDAMELTEAARRPKKPTTGCGRAEINEKKDTDRLFWESCLSS